MNIGIIAEGRSDQLVLMNILKSFGIESNNVKYLRPELRYDASDLNAENRTLGGWTRVKKDCVEQTVLDKFFYISDNKYIIIQIDSAECEDVEFGIKKPDKSNIAEYSTILRALIIEKLKEWHGEKYGDKLLYAISIEEIEAWILTIFIKSETAKQNNPKRKLEFEIPRKGIKIKGTTEAEIYEELTKDFHKPKKLNAFIENNQSLKDFVESLRVKLGLV